MHLSRFLIDPRIAPAVARASSRPSIKHRQPLTMIAGLGACLALLASPACGKKTGSPDWSDSGDSRSETISRPATSAPGTGRKTRNSALPSGGLRFVAYNVNNWLTMERGSDRATTKGVPKPAAEKRAVIRLLSRHVPDVIGICEVGTREDLTEIQAALKADGLDLPNSHYGGGGDEVRHLGLLSRFPIIRTAKPAVMDFRLNGVTLTMNRGILDATIEANGKPYRLLGVHLKSKREVESGDQDAMRLGEARLLRRHVDAILKADPDARLIVYGDFNDTRGSATLKVITGNTGDPDFLTAIPAADKQGERWTHFWSIHDIYSRFDYIAVTRSLKQEVDLKQSRIIDDPEWNTASDHRALLAVFN